MDENKIIIYKINGIDKSKKKKNYRLLEIVLSAILCLETAVLGYILYPIFTRKSEHSETLKRIEANANIDSIDVYKRLLHAVKNNNNLGRAEKEYIIDYLDNLVIYKNYIDIDYLEEKLSTLKITYRNNKALENKNVMTKGEYSHFRNEITFFGVDNIEDLEITTFNHELFHVMQKDYYGERNEFLIETVNTIFNEDVTGLNEKTMYSSYYNYTKMLMEVIGVEPFCKYQGYATTEPIIDALVNIYGTEKDAKNLLNDMDEYKIIYDKYANENMLYSDKCSKKLNELNDAIICQIGNYYEKKYGFTMDNDLIMLFYYDYYKFIDEIGHKFYIDGKITSIYRDSNTSYFKEENIPLVINTCGRAKIINIYVDDESQNTEKIEDRNIKYVIDDNNRYLNNVKRKLNK